MPELTQLLDAAASGDRQAAADLLPHVYDALRQLAAARLAQERPGQTLEATALVHEAYLRLVGPADDARWQNRGHFFAAAAEAMRRILVDSARRKAAVKHGVEAHRVTLDDAVTGPAPSPNHVVAMSDALDELERHDEPAAQLVKLRYFAGLSHQQAADALGVSRRAADRLWALARAWLHQRLQEL